MIVFVIQRPCQYYAATFWFRGQRARIVLDDFGQDFCRCSSGTQFCGVVLMVICHDAVRFRELGNWIVLTGIMFLG